MKKLKLEEVMSNAPGFQIIRNSIGAMLCTVPNLDIARRAIKKVVDNILIGITDKDVKSFLEIPCGCGPIYRTLLDSIVKSALVDALSGNHNFHPEVVDPKFLEQGGFFFNGDKDSAEILMAKVTKAIPQLTIAYQGVGYTPELAIFATYYDFKLELIEKITTE